jgi:hypothetical protein
MEQIMHRPSESVRELEEAISSFITSFELVFDNDWEMTKSCITDDCFIRENGTFIQPGVSDESNNWGNRGSLLWEHFTLFGRKTSLV